MNFQPTSLDEVIHITPQRFVDIRGFFAETYSHGIFARFGIDVGFVQGNHSRSALAGTVRGLHFQAPPHARSKLVRCGRGAIFDVAVDIRKGSPTYGKRVGYELTEDNGPQIYVPASFAHGFMTLHPNREIAYRCTDYYSPETEGAVRWNDPNIGIAWPLQGEVILSEKDAAAPMLAKLKTPFIYEYTGADANN